MGKKEKKRRLKKGEEKTKKNGLEQTEVEIPR